MAEQTVTKILLSKPSTQPPGGALTPFAQQDLAAATAPLERTTTSDVQHTTLPLRLAGPHALAEDGALCGLRCVRNSYGHCAPDSAISRL